MLVGNSLFNTINQATLKQFYGFRKSKYGKSKEEALARLVAYNMGDGTICNRYQTYRKESGEISKYYHNQASFYSNNEDDLRLIARDLVVSGIRETKPNILFKKGTTTPFDSYQIHISRKQADALIELGCPVGKKVEQGFPVPEWIVNGSDNIKAEFLAALWGAEGFKATQNNFRKCKTCKNLVLAMSKYHHEDGVLFFSQLVKMLNDLGINSSTTSSIIKKAYIFRLYIDSHKQNMKRFFDIVGYRYSTEKEFLGFLWSNYYDAHLKTADFRKTKRVGWNFPSFDDWVKNHWNEKIII